MRYSMIAAPLALAAGVSANMGNGTIQYTTEIVSSFTTYCPAATSVVHGGSTYTVTEATTLTITNCPCTVTKPATSAPVVAATSAPAVVSSPAAVVPAASSAAPVAPAASSAAPAPAPAAPSPVAPVFSNSTAPQGTVAPSASAPVSPVAPSASPFTGAGNKVAASSFSLAALLGLAAYLL